MVAEVLTEARSEELELDISLNDPHKSTTRLLFTLGVPTADAIDLGQRSLRA